MEDEIKEFTRNELLRNLCPFGDISKYHDKSTDELRKILHDSLYEYYDFSFEEFDQTDEQLEENLDRKVPILQARERELFEQKKRLENEEKVLSFRKKKMKKRIEKLSNTPIATRVEVPNIRPPDVSYRETLLPNNFNMDDILHESEVEYDSMNARRSREDEEFEEAKKQSLEEFNRMIISSIKFEDIESPNYSKIQENAGQMYTKELIDKFFNLLKNKQFTEFREEVSKSGIAIETSIWKRFSYNGSTLKQLVFSENKDSYKVFL